MPFAILRKSPLAALAVMATTAAHGQGLETGAGLAGSYLAARAAVIDGNHRAAAAFFDAAIAADPQNPILIGNALFANAAMGQWQRAAEVASALPTEANGQELANLVRFVAGLQREDLIGARAAIEAGQGAGPLIDGLALGWIYLGEGNMSRAVEAFEAVAQADPGLADIAYTQLALARAAVGDFEGAEAILSGEERGRVTATERVVEARAEILVQLDRRQDALDLLDFYTEAVPDPSLLTVRARIAGADTVAPYDFVTNAQEGLGEVFFAVARALGADGGSTTLPLLYAQAAYAITPGLHDAALFAAELIKDTDQYAMAASAFARVPADSEHYVEAQLGRADALFDGGAEDAAVLALQTLAEERPTLATVHAALGDMLRRTDECEAAVEAYSRALDLVDTTQSRYWFVFYTRAICHERLDNWPPAEADFRQALVLNPDQPNVLNYLGYSLVEQRRNLEEALDMIERAVAARPDSGFITDSLGWVFYRLGRYEDAVAPMERAVELEPNDPVINDHLGDVYWMVGRYREAEFQWHRALSFDPEEEEAARIRRKLDIGLDDVLAEEAALGDNQ